MTTPCRSLCGGAFFCPPLAGDREICYTEYNCNHAPECGRNARQPVRCGGGTQFHGKSTRYDAGASGQADPVLCPAAHAGQHVPADVCDGRYHGGRQVRRSGRARVAWGGGLAQLAGDRSGAGFDAGIFHPDFPALRRGGLGRAEPRHHRHDSALGCGGGRADGGGASAGGAGAAAAPHARRYFAGLA